MEGKKSILSLFVKHIAEIFTLTIIANTIVGWMLGESRPEMSSIFALEGKGLSYQTITEFFAWSCVISILIVIFTSDKFFVKIMLLWRCMILFVLGTASCIMFAAIFEWLPRDAWETWFGFIAFFTSFFGIGLFGMYAKTRFEDKRYEKLLSKYKENQAINKGEEN